MLSGKKTSDCIAHSVFCLIFLVVAFSSLNLVYGAPAITYNDSITPANNSIISDRTWINVSIGSSEDLNQSILEWGNSSGFTNVTMSNASDMLNWSVNMSGLSAGQYNYTVWAQNTTDGNWTQSERRFVIVSAISACQNLTVGNVSYTLIQNVSSAGTCFIILANNVTIDGAGHTINYSQSATGYAINNTGYNRTTIKNSNILSNTDYSESIAVYFFGASNGTIQNNTITTSGAAGGGIAIGSSSNSNITNNTITTTGSNGYGILLDTSNNSNIANNIIATSKPIGIGIAFGASSNSNITNNTITTAGSSSYGIFLESSSNSNNFSNNAIITTNVTAYGVYIKSSLGNIISGGSIVAIQSSTYYLQDADTTNNFIATNFTTLRNISFADTFSYFKYNNDSSGNIWLTTNLSAASSINRTLTTWSNATMQWNDTNSTAGITANYTLTGLLPSTAYRTYNTSGSNSTNRSYNTDASGTLTSFTVSLNGNTEILLDSMPNITYIYPANNSYYNDSALSALVLNITTNEPAVWCGFSLNGTQNVSMNGSASNMSWNYSGISGASVGLNNITFFCNDSRGNIVNSTKYFTRDNIAPTITTPTHSTPTTTGSTITWIVNETADNTVYYKTSPNAYAVYTTTRTNGNSTVSITMSGLTSGRTYFYYVVSCDLAGNCATPSTEDQFNTASSGTTTTDDSSSTGTGTGTGDTASGLSKSWNSITAGSTAVMSLTSSSVDVTDIIFKATQALSKAKITVAKLSGKPSATTSTPTGSVYQYISITPENITDTKITSTTISFRVNSTWITSNLINMSTIKLYRYSGGAWNALVTHETGTSGSYKTFIAETPGFSYFAITGKLKGASTPAASNTSSSPAANQTINSTTANNTSITLSTPSSNVTSQSNETVSSSGIFGDTKTSLVVFIVIIIAVVVVLVFHEKLKINLPKLKLSSGPKFYAGQKTQSTQNSGHKYTFNHSEVKKAELVYKPQPKEEKVKYEYKPKK